MFLYLVAPPLFKTVSHFMNSLVQTTGVLHNFCAFPGATFPPTSWISPKKSLKSQNLRHWEKQPETLFFFFSGTLPTTTHFGWFQDASSWLPFDTGGRIGPLRLVLAALLALDAHRRPAASDLLDNPVFRRQARSTLGFFQVPGENDGKISNGKKRPVSNGDHENYCHFLGWLNQSWYKCCGWFWDISLARNCLGLAIYSDPCWRVKGCNQTGCKVIFGWEPTCCQVWTTLKLKWNWKNCKVSRWWFQTVLIFAPKNWKRFSFWRAYFFRWVETRKPPTTYFGLLCKRSFPFRRLPGRYDVRMFLKVVSLILRHPQS